MRCLGYIRTSTKKQLTDRQVLALKNECDQVFIEDGVSAVKKTRPVYNNVIKQLKEGDIFIVSSLDRAFRSSLDALSELEKLHQRNIQFKSLSQNFDTTTVDGKLLYTIAAALAEWEREILSYRTKEGLVAALGRGEILGRPHKLKKHVAINAMKLLENDPLKTLTSIAADLSIHPRTLRRSITRLSRKEPWNYKEKSNTTVNI